MMFNTAPLSLLAEIKRQQGFLGIFYRIAETSRVPRYKYVHLYGLVSIMPFYSQETKFL